MRSSSCSPQSNGTVVSQVVYALYYNFITKTHRIRLSDTGLAGVALASSSMIGGKALRDRTMRDLGAPPRLRSVAAAADKSRHAVRDHGADAHDVAIPECRQRVVLRAAEAGVD